MPTIAHVHTYVKYWPNKWKNKDLFKCNDPGCTHFEERSMIEGKFSCCTKCHAEFILDRDALRRVRPVCLQCSNTKKGQEARAVRDIINAMEIIEPNKPNEFPDPTGGID